MSNYTTVWLSKDTRDAFKEYVQDYGYDSYEQAILDMLYQDGYVERPRHRSETISNQDFHD